MAGEMKQTREEIKLVIKEEFKTFRMKQDIRSKLFEARIEALLEMVE